ncbi:MAG: alpha-ketoglutarate-dependent dioxygenase AlkB [Bacteriovorax sp.]|nr:alpha-ketoglutarate-dependent dioxygenase AlkB [Bacteriovorax sp.]
MKLDSFITRPEAPREILNHDGILLYQENFLTETIAEVSQDIIWRNDSISMYGKTHPLPRLTAWHGDVGITHSYSKIKMISPGWTPALNKIKDLLESNLDVKFNSVLINYYRDGNDHMSYHADDELELGQNPTIASLSFGETRQFHLKHRFDKTIETKTFGLESQSLLVMMGQLQHFWVHKISKSTKVNGPRLNLTYRYIH